MTTQTEIKTISAVLARYAAGIAFVAEEPVATTVSCFTDQLRTAAELFDMAGINGSNDLETAATYLDDASGSTDATERTALLGRAANLLAYVTDMVGEYRDGA